METTGLHSDAIERTIAELGPALASDGLGDLFAHCLRNTLETTVALQTDGTTFVVTGDIPAMWLRDSTAQVWPYLTLCRADPLLRRVIQGLILRQARCIAVDPYANAFTRDPRGLFGFAEDIAEQRPGVWERKWETDSLLSHLRLLGGYAEATGDAAIYAAPDVARGIQVVLQTLQVEQQHTALSPYHYRRPLLTFPYHDTATAHPVAPTGLIWSAFRPSDDGCILNYHVPTQMMAVVELGRLGAAPVSAETQGIARRMAQEIDAAIHAHAVVQHPHAGEIWAYEVDGLGHYVAMDDANVPSLLSAPYLGYCAADDPLYQRTRQFILSPENPSYYEGRYLRGVGSPHTPARNVWPLGVTMQALTSGDQADALELLRMLRDTTDGTAYMHESIDGDDPHRYTRPWFAWANSLCAELMMRLFAPSL